jgi:hypothetical protein
MAVPKMVSSRSELLCVDDVAERIISTGNASHACAHAVLRKGNERAKRPLHQIHLGISTYLVRHPWPYSKKNPSTDKCSKEEYPKERCTVGALTRAFTHPYHEEEVDPARNQQVDVQERSECR